MSLDVYLSVEVDVGGERPHEITLFDANITHNLNAMAAAAGIYTALWRPEEVGLELAGQLVPILEDGLEKLRAHPDEFRLFDSPNGWGLYVHFVPWVERYLAACVAYPKAKVRACP